MTALDQLRLRKADILAAVKRHHAGNVRVFGSVARGEATDVSDVDILVTMDGGASLLDLVAVERELAALLGRRTDVVDEGGLSPYLRSGILQEAVPL